MNCLEEKIAKDGIVKEGNVLKVDSFLNHQMDITLFNEMGKEWKKRFEGKQITKILTIEASGIGIACIVAQHFDVPVVFAKKAKSINLEGEMYIAEVESFTHKNKNQVIVSKKFLNEDDHVLMIDDLQFIFGKKSTQEEFFHTFNTLIAKGKKIILSADSAPSDLQGVEERLRHVFLKDWS